jgi:hypothetical protein
MRYYTSLVDLIGNTPLVQLRSVTSHLDPDTAPTVLAKVEYFNPGGSVKYRIAVRMIDAAEASGSSSRVGRSSSRRPVIPASDWRSWRSSAATSAFSSCRTRLPPTRSTP